MQKIIIFVLLGITFNCVLGEYVAKNFVKSPVEVINMNVSEHQMGRKMYMSSPAPGEIALTYVDYVKFTRVKMLTSGWTKTLNSTNLTVLSTSNTIVHPLTYNGYDIGITNLEENNVKTLVAIQRDAETKKLLPRFNIVEVSAEDAAPVYLNATIHNDTVYVCYTLSDILYVSSFKIGGSETDVSIMLSVNTTNAQIVAGGALPAHRVLITTTDSDNKYHEIQLDVTSDRTSSDMMNPEMVGLDCKPFVTGKYFGSFCSNSTERNYYVSINAVRRNLLFTLNESVTLVGQYSCGDHLVTITQDLKAEGAPRSYEIWDLETMQSITGKVEFLSELSDSTYTQILQVPEGSIYVMMLKRTRSDMGEKYQADIGILLENNLPAKYNSDDDMIVEYFLA